MEESHTRDYHYSCVRKLCRVCSKRERQHKEKRTFAFVSAKLKEEILTVCSLDISDDAEGTHPPHLCRQCYKKITNSRKPASGVPQCDYVPANEKSYFAQINQRWCAWAVSCTLSDCFACRTFGEQRAGAVSRKKSLPPSSESDLPALISLDPQGSVTCDAPPQCTSTPVKRPKLIDAQTSPFLLTSKVNVQTSLKLLKEKVL